MRFKRGYARFPMESRATVSQAIESTCYDSLAEGQFEIVDSKLNNAVEILARLTEMLADKGLLSAEDVLRVIGEGWTVVE